MHSSKSVRKILSVLVVAGLLCGTMTAMADYVPVPEPYYLISGETDAHGAMRADYILDKNGNEVVQETGYVSAAADTLPSSYDLRDYNCITPVKYQAGSGSCWAFSTISALESSYIRKGLGTVENTDFSEAHLIWFTQNQRCTDSTDPTYGDGKVYASPFAAGGNWNGTASQLIRGSGVQLESNAPWYESIDADEMKTQMAQPESDRYVSYARLWKAESIRDLSVTTVKQKIMELGTVMMSYYDDSGITNTGYNSTNYCYYQTAVSGKSNHAVSIVGWDDNFSKTLFNEGNQPSANGAWLIKGSWSTRYGNNGYYWVSYEDPSIVSFTAMEVASADIYENIYQYDGSYPGVLFSGTSNIAMANAFTAAGEEELTHVAFYNPNPYCNATIEVYLGSTSTTINQDNPTSGLQKVSAATTTVQSVCYGYRTVELPSAVTLTEGQKFVVKVSMQSLTDTKTYVPVEGKTVVDPSDGEYTFSGHDNSYIHVGSYWYSTSNGDLNGDYNDVPIKAMTTTIREELSIRTMPTKTTYYVGDTLDSSGLTLNLGTDVITEGFTCSPSVLSTVGTQTVTVTYADQTVTFDVTVKPIGQLILSGGTAHQGETIDVTVSLRDNPGMTALKLGLEYDSNALQLVSVTDAGLFGSDKMVSGGDLTQVPYQVLWMDAVATQNCEANGTLATFTFRVRDNAPVGTTTVTVHYDSASTFDADLSSVPLTENENTVRILSHLPGDVNTDGAVNLRDAVLLQRYLAGGWGVTIDTFNANVDGDTVLSLMDSTYICRYIVGGWDITLT